MVDDLLRLSLQRLRERLSNVAGDHPNLSCWLIEWPNMWAARAGEKPGWTDEWVVWASVDWECMELELDGIVRGENIYDGFPFDSDGKLLANPIRRTPDDALAESKEPFRALHLSLPIPGKRDIPERDRLRGIFRNGLQPILADAGNLLVGITPDAFPVPISSATMRAGNVIESWLYFLFDLAWAQLPNSPLRASLGKTHWYSDTAMEEYAPPHSIPEPEGWYSTIDDVVQASIYAIDILLTLRLQREVAAHGADKATPAVSPTLAAKTERGCGAGAAFAKVTQANPEPLARLQLKLAAFAAGIRAASDAVEKDPEMKTARKELTDAWAAFYEADEVSRRDWQQTFGTPFPASIEEWQRWAIRIDVSGRYLPAEKIASGDWRPDELLPYIEGYLQRLRDQQATTTEQREGNGATGSGRPTANGEIVADSSLLSVLVPALEKVASDLSGVSWAWYQGGDDLQKEVKELAASYASLRRVLTQGAAEDVSLPPGQEQTQFWIELLCSVEDAVEASNHAEYYLPTITEADEVGWEYRNRSSFSLSFEDPKVICHRLFGLDPLAEKVRDVAKRCQNQQLIEEGNRQRAIVRGWEKALSDMPSPSPPATPGPEVLVQGRKRPKVFISYSHKDKKFLKELLLHLKPLERAGRVTHWSDEQIQPGSKWFDEIKTALARSKVAILLVTKDFLASDFIHEHELTPLLKEAEKGGVIILWVLVRACSYRETPLKHYQAVISPDKPLAEMKAERDRAWVRICEEITKAANGNAGSETPAGTTGQGEANGGTGAG